MLMNRDRALGVMAQHGIDALLGTTPVNLAYLSGYRPWLHWFYRLYTTENFMFQSYALFPRDQGTAPALVAPTRLGNLAYQAEWPSWIEDVYTFGAPIEMEEPRPEYPDRIKELYRIAQLSKQKGSKTPGEALVKALTDRGLTRGVVGVDVVGMQPGQLEYARRELPNVQFKDAGELFRYIRMVKTADEVALLRKSAEINWQGFQALMKAAVPGATELDLVKGHRTGVSMNGGVPVFCNNACGPWAMNHWEPSDYYPLKPGDAVYCDAGCTYQYYHADTNLSAVLGEPSKRHRELFQAMSNGLSAAESAVRPGLRMSEVMGIMKEACLKSGAIKQFAGFGHAVGLEPRDMPMIQTPWETAMDGFIDMSADLPIETGMVFNLENAFREIGTGSVAVETTLHVTPTGCERLIPQPREIVVLPA